MTTTAELIEKYKMTASSNKISFVTTESISKKIMGILITHPNSYENFVSIMNDDDFTKKIILEQNFTADLEKFLSIHDIRKVFMENISNF